MTAARLAAYRALRDVLEGSDLPAALARVRDSLQDDRDRALVTELTGGVLRWMAALDAIIEWIAGRPTTRLDAEVLAVLRLGAYQILYLDRVPAAAAVDESVTLVKRAGKSSAAGLVNAVLRRVARVEPPWPLPPEPARGASRAEMLAYLSVTCSHPEWLVMRWLDRIGMAATKVRVRFNNRSPALTLRANRLRVTRTELARQLARHGVETVPTRFAGDGLQVVAGNPLRTPLAGCGLFGIQDEASQLVAELTSPQPGECVLDACAAPGGKTIALASAVGEAGVVVAGDLRAARVRLLRSTIEETGARRVRLIRHDLRRPPFQPVFDCVLVDAPCSGLGTLRRDPEIRWRRQDTDLARYASEQHHLLAQAAGIVRPGGRVVYATCSSEPEENDEVIQRFLAEQSEFDLVHPGRLEGVSTGVRAVVTAQGCLTTTPEDHDLEGFFGAILKRRE